MLRVWINGFGGMYRNPSSTLFLLPAAFSERAADNIKCTKHKCNHEMFDGFVWLCWMRSQIWEKLTTDPGLPTSYRLMAFTDALAQLLNYPLEILSLNKLMPFLLGNKQTHVWLPTNGYAKSTERRYETYEPHEICLHYANHYKITAH